MPSPKPLLVAVLLLTPTAALATSEAFLKVNVPYYGLQSGAICLMKQVVYSEIGSLPEAAMVGTLARTQIHRDFPSSHYVNVNLAATSPAMVGTAISEGATVDGVWEYTMTLDISALAASNGGTVTGRTATVLAAKLFLLAMTQNLAEYSKNRYRLWITFVGLPSQAGLPGTALYSTVRNAYSAPSPLLAAYRAELLNVDGSCQKNLE